MKNHSYTNDLNSSQYTNTECIKKPISTPTPEISNINDESINDEGPTGLIEALELYEDSYSTLDESEYNQLLSVFSELLEND